MTDREKLLTLMFYAAARRGFVRCSQFHLVLVVVITGLAGTVTATTAAVLATATLSALAGWKIGEARRDLEIAFEEMAYLQKTSREWEQLAKHLAGRAARCIACGYEGQDFLVAAAEAEARGDRETAARLRGLADGSIDEDLARGSDGGSVE